MSLYKPEHREHQDRFETRALADRLEQVTVSDVIDEGRAQFIESRDFFFLSTVNGVGEPTVSYKGGSVGFVQVIGARPRTRPLSGCSTFGRSNG